MQKDIRIGTLVQAHKNPVEYIKQILPYGFESFGLTFGNTTEGINWQKLSGEINGLLAGTDAVISSLGIYGNPLETLEGDLKVVKGWEECIENAHLFSTDIVAGFAGRLRNKPIDESIPRFKEVFTPLTQRAADNNVRIAFENCDMGGNWKSGDYNIATIPDAWEMMFDAVPADNLGLQWEPCHQMVKLIDPMPQLRKWVKKIFHVHGKDATVMWDVVKEHGISSPVPFAFHRTPGFGDSNWTDIISELRRGGFTGSIDIEGWHDPVYRGGLEMTGQVHALNYLKQCRADFVPNPEA